MFLNSHIIVVWISVIIFTASAAEFQTHFCYLNTTRQENNTAYFLNVNKVLESLASDTQVNKESFLNRSVGTSQQDMAYGLYLCRKDLVPTDCRNCLLKAREDINKTCAFSKAAVAWRDTCMLRYANYSIFSTMDSETYISECNKVNISENISEQGQFWEAVKSLMGRLSTKSSYDVKKYAFDNVTYNNTTTVYGYVQCTPDLTDDSCEKCLQVSIDRLRQHCDGRQGARVLAASCNVRFEIYEILPPVASGPSSDTPGKKNTSKTIIAAIVSVFGFLLLIVGIF